MGWVDNNISKILRQIVEDKTRRSSRICTIPPKEEDLETSSGIVYKIRKLTANMFKLNLPTTLALSTGSLVLLALCSVLLVASSAYTSDIKPESAPFVSKPTETAPAISEPESSHDEKDFPASSTASISNHVPAARRRDGRMYGRSSYESSQQANPIENYAAAYGAASGSPSSQDQSSSSGMVQSSVQANDASSYASFGESLPSSSISSVSPSARQNEYSNAHSPYYASYMSPSSNSASYSGQQASSSGSYPALHSMSASAHYPNLYAKGSHSLPVGYPTNGYERSPLSGGYYDRSYMGASSVPLWASGTTSGGLMSSATSAISHWAGGFSIGEIICGLVALAIGAVILGAPFFLIYLALMGNFSGSGTLSLTNPTGGATPAGGPAATANGRRKRLAIYEQLNSLASQKHSVDFMSLAESIANRIGPHVDLQQVAATFKRLINSVEHYSQIDSNSPDKRGKLSR